MCHGMRMRRFDRLVQVQLDEGRYRKVAGEAARRRVSVATVIREAIDDLPAEPNRRRTAIAEILAADPMPVPVDPADVRREIDTAHELTE